MHSFDLSQCLPALFTLFHVNTTGELGIYVFALENMNKRCFVLGGFLPRQTLEIRQETLRTAPEDMGNDI